MLILTATTDNLQVVLGGAITTNQLPCVSSWRDITTTAYTPGRTTTNTNSTTDVNIVPAPAASTQRVIDSVSIYNKDTVAALVTVKYDANGTEYVLWSATLAVSESVQYVEGAGWQKLSADGILQTDPQPARPIVPLVVSITSSATPTPDVDITELYDITALATAPTFGAPTGTPANGQNLIIRIKDNGTLRALAWNAAYIAGGIALPTTTVASKILTVGFKYDTANALNKWMCVASVQET